MGGIPEDVMLTARAVVDRCTPKSSHGCCEDYVGAIARAILTERERWQDKIDGLEADLDSAVEVAWKRGAHEWVRLNYPKHSERFAAAISEEEEEER